MCNGIIAENISYVKTQSGYDITKSSIHQIISKLHSHQVKELCGYGSAVKELCEFRDVLKTIDDVHVSAYDVIYCICAT